MELNNIDSQRNVVNNIQTENKVYTPKVDLSTPEDTIELSNKKNSIKKRAAIAAAVLTAAVVTAAIAYKVKQHKIASTTPKELKDLFKNLKHKKGDDFINSAYDGIKEHMGLKGIAPDKVNLTDKADGLFNTVTGGYNPIKNTIEYSQGFRDKLTQRQQFNLLSHELKHAKQYSTALRTEGIGLKGVVDAEVTKQLSGMKIIGNTTKEQAEAFMKEERESLVKSLTEQIKQNHTGSLTAPKIAANSAEGLQAAKYIDAIKKYEGTFFGLGGKNYRENLLEVEAYAFGDKMENMFGSSRGFFGQIKDIFRVAKNAKK